MIATHHDLWLMGQIVSSNIIDLRILRLITIEGDSDMRKAAIV